MSVRVGRIMRHEDVHGVSGEGDHKADVFEASDGTCIVRWLGKDGSTNVYAGVKNVTNVHAHGGKTEIKWLWEQERDPDPMDAVFEKKILEAGGSTAVTKQTDAEEAAKDAEAEKLAEEIVEDAADTVELISEKVAVKLKEKVAEKTAKKVVAKKVEDAAK